MYAISTLGSFVGTFLPVLVSIPLLGTTLTFALFSGLLLCVALAGLWLNGDRKRALQYIWMPLALLISTLLILNRPIKSSEGQIFESESAYNYIQVLEKDGYHLLRLNEGQGIHSVWHPDRLDYYGPWEMVLVAPFFNRAPYELDDLDRLAIIGLAGGTIARQVSEVYGSIPIDGYEIDPQIIEVGRQYFAMNQPNLTARAEDGRWGLARSEEDYDVIALDAYRPPYIPWHLTTVEFFQVVSDHLTEDGVVAINVGSAPGDANLLESIIATMGRVFPSIYVVEVPGSYNSVVFATSQPTEIENLYQNYLHLEGGNPPHPLLMDAYQRVIVNLQPFQGGGIVFTDDRAPVEWITNNMVLNFIFFEGMEDFNQ